MARRVEFRRVPVLVFKLGVVSAEIGTYYSIPVVWALMRNFRFFNRCYTQRAEDRLLGR
jgi:hypothetical protein